MEEHADHVRVPGAEPSVREVEPFWADEPETPGPGPAVPPAVPGPSTGMVEVEPGVFRPVGDPSLPPGVHVPSPRPPADPVSTVPVSPAPRLGPPPVQTPPGSPWAQPFVPPPQRQPQHQATHAVPNQPPVPVPGPVPGPPPPGPGPVPGPPPPGPGPVPGPPPPGPHQPLRHAPGPVYTPKPDQPRPNGDSAVRPPYPGPAYDKGAVPVPGPAPIPFRPAQDEQAGDTGPAVHHTPDSRQQSAWDFPPPNQPGPPRDSTPLPPNQPGPPQEPQPFQPGPPRDFQPIPQPFPPGPPRDSQPFAPPNQPGPPQDFQPFPPNQPGPPQDAQPFAPPNQPGPPQDLEPFPPSRPGPPQEPQPFPPAELDPFQELNMLAEATPTAEEFARRRLARPAQQSATMGTRAMLRKTTFGLLNLAPGQDELEYKKDVETVRRNFGGLRQVTVVNPKGGAGKTVAVLLLAMTFGQKRGGYVLAWDNNETQGTLGMRAQQDFHARTVRDMMRDLHLFQGAQGRVGDLSQYVRSQGEGMFDVLASDESATAGEMLTSDAFAEIRDVVSRFYKLIFVDTGNNVRAENWQAAMDATDQLVITMSARNDSAEPAARALDHLEQSGRRRLVRQAVTIVTMPPTRKDIDLQWIEQHFRARTRAVLVAPYERLLDSGEPIRYGELSNKTKEAWLKIAAAVAEGL